MLGHKSLSRREFIAASAAAGIAGQRTAAAATEPPRKATATATATAANRTDSTAESLVARLYQTLSESQHKEICFDWNHRDPKRGLLRTYVANNWSVTGPEIVDDFYSRDQRELITEIFESIIHPDWHQRYYRQLSDDAGGFGHQQSIAIFGKPGANDPQEKFEFVLTGRHMTLRCDGDSADHVAFGGPIFYGHAPAFYEDAGHASNVFWHQAKAANRLYQMLSGSQQSRARVSMSPREDEIGFRGQQSIPGLPVTDMTDDQKEHLQAVLGTLVEMYRPSDQTEALACLRNQGGLDACSLSFFTDQDIGGDGVWDNWRLEGPSFVWHYRGAPHVHVWVNVAGVG
jgi:hypothetical protein